ncbi:MAG: hypothetical protein AAF597_20850, partial [Bacteroidota bacterium]
MRFIVLVTLLSLFNGLHAQALTRMAVAEDLQRMISAMELYHCNAYLYQDSVTIASLRHSLIGQLPEHPTAMEAYRAANLLACAFGDGHTRVWDYGVEKAYREAGGTYLPLAVDAYGGRLVVRADYRETDAPLIGAEITAINGVATATLLADMSRHASRETAALDLALLSRNFRRYLWLTYPWATGDFTISLADGRKRHINGHTAQAITQHLP